VTVKKRLIFTLFYADGHFMLSRNFTIQKVGDLEWLERNYNFSKIAHAIDELIILDISRDERDTQRFREHVQAVAKDCFVPIAAGGGIRYVEDARQLLRNGADKVVINSLFATDPKVVSQVSKEFGGQSIIASVDAQRFEDGFYPRTENGQRQESMPLGDWVQRVLECQVGEIYLNSIDRDGTGQGYQLQMLDTLPVLPSVPLILAGGAGKGTHFIDGLKDRRVDAVATGNLFNFVGDGLIKARQRVLEEGIELAAWEPAEIDALHMSLAP
jgi:cyclase